MELESRKVFIDTQAFVRMGLNFNHPALQSFFELCKNGSLTHLTTTVVKREVESKIRDSIKGALSSLQDFRRKARMLEAIEDDKIKVLFSKIQEEDVYKKALSVFDDFIVRSNSKVITASGIDAEEIVNLYFERKAPFGDGKKKAEFPDAITLSSILVELGKERAYVISDDPDLKKFCDDQPQLICIETLDKFLDLYNEHESAITELVKTYLSSITTHIKQKIQEFINDAGAYNKEPWDGSEVDYFKVTKVWDFEPSVVLVDEEECLITFDVDVDYEYTVTGPDFVNTIYDNESDQTYTFGSTSHTGATSSAFTVELGFTYDLIDGKLINIEESEFYVAGVSDGVAVYVEEIESDFW